MITAPSEIGKATLMAPCAGGTSGLVRGAGEALSASAAVFAAPALASSWKPSSEVTADTRPNAAEVWSNFLLFMLFSRSFLKFLFSSSLGEYFANLARGIDRL